MRLPVRPVASIRVVKGLDFPVHSNALIPLTLQFTEKSSGFVRRKNMLPLHGGKNQQPLVCGIHDEAVRHISDRLRLEPQMMLRTIEIPRTGKKKPQVIRHFRRRADG